MAAAPGGGSDPHGHGARSARVAVLTVSDTRTPETDGSGRVTREMLEAAGHAVVDYRVVPDDPAAVRAAVRELLARADCDGVLLNGGTGVSRRDRTHEAIAELLDRRLDGFGELFRMLSWQEIGSAAMLSRAIGGIASDRVVFAMPGSTAAVRLAMERLVLPQLPHLLGELRK